MGIKHHIAGVRRVKIFREDEVKILRKIKEMDYDIPVIIVSE
jgi:hypothetical protein